MSVLVTGAAGFVGRRIVAALHAAGHEVIAIVRPGSRHASVGADGVRVLEAELSEGMPCGVLPRVIVHAAAAVAPDGNYLRDNAQSTVALARFAVESGVASFIYLSSVSVYGTITVGMVDEDTPVRDPGGYGASKFLGEMALRTVGDRLPSVSLRLPGIVGPGATGPWLARLVAAARQGAPLVVNHPEAMFNNVVHVDDLAGFVVRLASRSWEGARAVTLGAAAPLPVRQLAAEIIAACASSAPVIVREAHGSPFLISSRTAVRDFGFAEAGVIDVVRRCAGT